MNMQIELQRMAVDAVSDYLSKIPSKSEGICENLSPQSVTLQMYGDVSRHSNHPLSIILFSIWYHDSTDNSRTISFPHYLIKILKSCQVITYHKKEKCRSTPPSTHSIYKIPKCVQRYFDYVSLITITCSLLRQTYSIGTTVHKF